MLPGWDPEAAPCLGLGKVRKLPWKAALSDNAAAPKFYPHPPLLRLGLQPHQPPFLLLLPSLLLLLPAAPIAKGDFRSAPAGCRQHWRRLRER